MIAVLFEVAPRGPAEQADYLQIAEEMRPLLDQIDGFVSVERFQSLTNPARMLSLSFFRDEAALEAWRTLPCHRAAQAAGRHRLFADYRLRIAHVIRDYSLTDRDQAPPDSRAQHG